MAERRMFAKTIIDSEAFLKMPTSAQCLYFHLGIHADENGYNPKPKAVARMINVSEEYLQMLEENNFIIFTNDGIKMNNRGVQDGAKKNGQ
ncbi:hypothetical protein [Enterococcus sp. AZ050]|uniref:hypothetical protein n=1 Tax=Enterococcus sp. AZ050 TaxID=2774696 RepID=UPI003F2344F6